MQHETKFTARPSSHPPPSPWPRPVPPVAPHLQLLVGDVPHVHFAEAVAEGARQRLAPGVGSRRVLRGKQHEVWVRPDGLVELWHVELAVVVQEAVERLQHVRGRQIELVQNDPTAQARRLHQRALHEHQLARLVRHVPAQPNKT